MEKTPLDEWISQKTGIDGPPGVLRLSAYQLLKLRETLGLVRKKSRFYRELLRDFTPESIQSLSDVSRLPFTTPADIAAHPESFLCVPPRDISRIVTLATSGTTGSPKRLFFTEADQELTVDFFHRGMTTLAGPGDRVMIFMPGAAPGSVGDLLRKGLARFDCQSVVYGPVRDYEDALDALTRENITVIVGIPSQILRLSRLPARLQKPALKSVLLSADAVPASVTRSIGEAWGVPVYGHYGMTEMGLGGGVECAARCGYHLREADLLIEIVDPESGKPVPDGQYGEVVFTTLTRTGMPLIRYKTGDSAGMLTEPCPCGSVLRRLGRVTGRIAEKPALAGGRTLTLAELDELLYADPSVFAFSAELTREDGADCLDLTVEAGEAFDGAVLREKIDGLLCGLAGDGRLRLEIRRDAVGFHTTGTLKRRLIDKRNSESRVKL